VLPESFSTRPLALAARYIFGLFEEAWDWFHRYPMAFEDYTLVFTVIQRLFIQRLQAKRLRQRTDMDFAFEALHNCLEYTYSRHISRFLATYLGFGLVARSFASRYNLIHDSRYKDFCFQMCRFWFQVYDL
jgi:hypothetical protein